MGRARRNHREAVGKLRDMTIDQDGTFRLDHLPNACLQLLRSLNSDAGPAISLRQLHEIRDRRSWRQRSEEHTSELQSLMRISYAVFCLKKKIKTKLRNVSKTENTHQHTKHTTEIKNT